MATFNNQHLDIAGRSIPMDLGEFLGAGATIHLVCADRLVNRGYRQALATREGRDERLRRIAESGRIDDAQEDEEREDDIVLFPRHVIVGWDRIPDAEGGFPEYTPENGEAWLRSLPSWLVDRIRLRAKVPDNYIENVPSTPNELVGKS